MPPAVDPNPCIPELSPGSLRDRLAGGEPLTLLDVREPKERAFCSIAAPEGVVNLHIPMREIVARIDEIEAALSRGPMVVYCHHGVRSLAVAEWLAQRQPGQVFNL